jgi:hypothetical protein
MTKRKAALVVSIIKGETSIQEGARQHGLGDLNATKYPWYSERVIRNASQRRSNAALVQEGGMDRA